MKLITRYELQTKDIYELQGLLKECFNALVKSEYGTVERSNALASIENIQREIGRRVC